MTTLADALRIRYPGIRLGPYPDGAECVLHGDSIAHWSRQEAQPDEATLVASITVQEQADFDAVNGGDPDLTKRQKAKDSLDTGQADVSIVNRAIIREMNQLHNKLQARIAELQAVLAAIKAATATAADMQAAIPDTWLNAGDRQVSKLMDDVRDRITAGDAD